MRNGDEVAIPIAQSYKDCVTLIQSDYCRLTGRKTSIGRILISTLVKTHFATLFWMRLSNYKGWLYFPCRLMYKMVCMINQIDIPPTTKIGYGFYIGHGVCIVVNSGTVIGNNVNISQFLNIGTNHETPAIIGDNVYIGPMVCVVEDVNIGNNATIGAGAVVTRDVPKDCTVAGCPARVLNYNHPGIYIGNRWQST